MARSLDTSFLIDLLRGHPGATEKARQFDSEGEAVLISAPVLAEYLDGAHFVGGSHLEGALQLIAGRDVVPFDKDSAVAAGEIRANLRKMGRSIAMIDAMVAGIALRHHHVLVSRDSDFSLVPGLAVESY